ncbi:hypothetical protein Tco_0381393 [Tanacetum coccineum]
MPSWTSSESRVISGRVEYFCKCNRQLTIQTATTRKNLELLYEMFQKQKRSKKHMDYEQVVDVLVMDKPILEEELRAAKSKLKLYDRCYILAANTTANAKQMLQMQLQMLAANATANVKQMHSKENDANAKQGKCCKCNCKCNYKCKANAIAWSKANAYCKCLLQ